jgi:hypothetical protein
VIGGAPVHRRESASMNLLYALIVAAFVVWVFWPRKDDDPDDPRVW